MGQLMPILKPAGYRKEYTLFFKKLLFDNPSSPVIAFGVDQGNRIDYEGASNQEEYDQKLPVIEEQSLQNLKEVTPDIEFQDFEGSKIAFVTGHEYASEKIIDVAFMKELSTKLGADSLMVGIPFKGQLIAIDANGNLRLKFPAVIKKHYDNPQQDPISEHVFLVQYGDVIAMAGETIKDDASDNLKITENTKTNNYTVEVLSKTIDELTDLVNTSFKQIMSMIMTRKIFGGEISFQLTNTIPLTDQLIEKCNSYVAQIEKNDMAQTLTQALTKSGIKLFFFHNGKQIAPKIDSSKANESSSVDYSKFSEQELNNEFYTIVSIPNARTNIEALTRMSNLMKEFKARGLELPGNKPTPSTNEKKWWQFWK
jgi:hypothetical protein